MWHNSLTILILRNDYIIIIISTKVIRNLLDYNPYFWYLAIILYGWVPTQLLLIILRGEMLKWNLKWTVDFLFQKLILYIKKRSGLILNTYPHDPEKLKVVLHVISVTSLHFYNICASVCLSVCEYQQLTHRQSWYNFNKFLIDECII